MIADVCMTLLMDPISRVLAGQAARASEVRRFRHQVRVESYRFTSWIRGCWMVRLLVCAIREVTHI